jgi:hypothetical protein
MFTGNIDFKEKFLKEIENGYSSETDATLRYYNNLFNSDILNLYENLYGKDLYDFTSQEFILYMKALRKTNKDTLASDYSKIRKYLLHASDTENKVSIFNVNPNIGFRREDMEMFAYHKGEEEKVITKNELRELLTRIDPKTGNQVIPLDQDKAIYILAFNKVVGKEAEDLCRFKKEWFKPIEGVLLFNGEHIRLEEWESDILQLAIEEKSFSADPYSKFSKGFDCGYLEGEFLIKRRLLERGVHKIKTSSIYATNKQIIANRIRKINKALNTPFLTLSALYASGVAYDMLSYRQDWTQTKVTNYLKEYNIPLTPQRVLRTMEIMKVRLEYEKSLDQVSVTE